MIPKLGKLIRLLDSDVAAEALAARDAIRRALAREDLDFNDLAYELDGTADRPRYADGYADGRAAGHADGVAATLGKLEKARLEAWRAGLADGRRECRRELQRESCNPVNLPLELDRICDEQGRRAALCKALDHIGHAILWIKDTRGTRYAHGLVASMHALIDP